MRARSAISALVLLGACSMEPGYEPRVPQGDAKRGRAALEEFECGACHRIPGVSGSYGYVGPPLDTMRQNLYVAGKFPNTPENLARWIVDPPALAPQTAMPNVGVSEQQALDMAAYLYSID
jgi:cytochrome c